MLVWVMSRRLKRRCPACNIQGMSLNRAEQVLFDYVEKHAEERQFWTAKVRDHMARSRDDFATAASLALELRRYWDERARVGALPGERVGADRNPPALASFRNLAEHLMRLWGPARPRRPAANERP